MTSTAELAALKSYLTPDVAGQWDDAELSRTYAAEQADQARRCRIPTAGEPPVPVYPLSLTEALLRRVARNLAMRKVPLGTAASADGLDMVRIGSSDPEISRLEGPYRRVVV